MVRKEKRPCSVSPIPACPTANELNDPATDSGLIELSDRISPPPSALRTARSCDLVTRPRPTIISPTKSLPRAKKSVAFSDEISFHRHRDFQSYGTSSNRECYHRTEHVTHPLHLGYMMSSPSSHDPLGYSSLSYQSPESSTTTSPTTYQTPSYHTHTSPSSHQPGDYNATGRVRVASADGHRRFSLCLLEEVLEGSGEGVPVVPERSTSLDKRRRPAPPIRSTSVESGCRRCGGWDMVKRTVSVDGCIIQFNDRYDRLGRRGCCRIVHVLSLPLYSPFSHFL